MSNTTKIEYDGHTYSGTEIKGGNIRRTLSLLSASIESDTFNVSLKSPNKNLAAFTRNAPLTVFNRDRKLGTFYVQTVKRIASDLYDISAISAIGLLITLNHYGGIYTGQTVSDVLPSIFGTVPYSVKTNLCDIALYGWLPIGTSRDNLAQILFAIGATVKTDLNGVIKIEKLWDGVSSAITPNRIYSGASEEYTSEISRVSVTEHQYIEGGDLVTLFEGNTKQGDIITFSDPHYGLVASGFSILESNANYAKVSSGSGTLRGCPYVHYTHEIKKFLNSMAEENEKSVKDATLVSLFNSNAIAEYLANYYKCRQTINASVVLDTENPGDVVSIYHPFGDGYVEACLENEDITLSNTLKAQEKSLVGFTPIDLNTRLVNRVEILTGSGTWSPPVGVNEFRAVLIQGGGAGESGENGANATTATVKSQSNTTTSGQGYVTPFFSNLRNSTSGGNGGAGGDGGVGGKIYEADFSNTDGKSYPYSCGIGADTPGTEGTETMFGNASSESGTRRNEGYQDLFSGIYYGKKGVAGEAGGNGGKNGADGDSTASSMGGSGATASVKKQSSVSGTLYSLIEVGRFQRAGGGGAGGGSGATPGGNGTSQTGNPSCTFTGSLPSFSATGTGVSGGKGGNGANGSPAETYGSGGNGGGGGGGGGGSGDTFLAFGTTRSSISWPEQQATFTSRISATAGAQGGTGGTGGKGADGCILVYYSVEEQIGQPKQLKDRTGKMALDRYGRRIIM